MIPAQQQQDEHWDDALEQAVTSAVDAWLRWLPAWSPASYRGRSRMCTKCTGSPILLAAGLASDVPHQVAHALNGRMHRIIEREVDAYTERALPTLHAELSGAELWESGGFQPGAGLDPEYDGLDLDPEAEEGHPYLFTMAELAEQSRAEPPLPRPPLSAEEKARLHHEIELADRVATDTGQRLCFALRHHRARIMAAVQRFVEPQIQALLDELTRGLEPPR